MENYKLKELDFKELEDINGGWILFVAGAFVAGVTYGYIKEKIDSEQW